MNALSYEYLIRSAYDVSRGGRGGAADASLYRDWEVAIRGHELQKAALKKRQAPHDVRSIEELDYEVRAAAARIRENISYAINHVLSSPRPKELEAKLLKCKGKLKPDLYDKKKIDLIIDEVWEIFRELKLPQT